MPILVSVVVATYRTGAALDQMVESVGRQTIGTDRLELLAVDDGSGDDTAGRLRELAAERPWLHVREIPASGWPCRPRNVAIDAARGEWILVMDHDDLLFPDALEHLVAAGSRAGADLVVGKEVRTGGRTMGLETFRRSVDRAHVTRDHVLDMVTPHRLYRRAFLDAHGLRFDEGLRRLEDHHLNAACYVHDPVISVVADHACYQWVIHTDNSSLRPPDPGPYFEGARRTLDLVDHWPHGREVREDAYRWWWRATVLNRVSPNGLGAWELDYARGFLTEARRVVAARVAERLDPSLSALDRIRAAAVRAGDLDLVRAVATGPTQATTRPEVTEAASGPDGLRLRVRVGLLHGDGTAHRLRRTPQGRILWPAPGALPGGLDPVDVTEEVKQGAVDVVVVERATNAEWFVPTRVSAQLVPVTGDTELVEWEAEAEALVDPRTALLGHPLAPGTWDLRLHTRVLGHDSRVTLRLGDTQPPEDLGAPDLRVGPYRTRNGRLALRVRGSAPGEQGRDAPGASAARPRRRVRTRLGRARALLARRLPGGR